MNWKPFLVFVLMAEILCDVQYASGYSQNWYNVVFYAGNTYSQTITFPSQFSRVPQVSINPMIIKNLYNSATAEVGFELSITSITKSNFIVSLKPLSGNINFLTLNWIAVDDKRIEIFTNFNVANPQSTILQHNNINANRGIILLTSFYGKTKLDFTLGLGAITTSTVEVKITQQNMNSLGYIVILGPTEFFNIENEVIQAPIDEQSTNVYVSRHVSLVQDKIWIFFHKYFTFKVERNIIFELLPTFQSTQTFYKYCTWETNTYQSFLNGCHQCVTLNFVLTTLKPILYQKLRISGAIYLEQTNIIEFSIPVVSKTYTQQVTNDQVIIPQNTPILTFLLKVKCDKNYKITAQFYKCDSPCSNQYQTYIRYCYDPENTLQFYITYRSQNPTFYQSLNVIFSTTQIQIYQILANQVQQSVLVSQFDIQ